MCITGIRWLGPLLGMRLYGLRDALRSHSLWRPIIELIPKGQVVVLCSIRGGGKGMLGNKLVLIVMPCCRWLGLTLRARVRCGRLRSIR